MTVRWVWLHFQQDPKQNSGYYYYESHTSKNANVEVKGGMEMRREKITRKQESKKEISSTYIILHVVRTVTLIRIIVS